MEFAVLPHPLLILTFNCVCEMSSDIITTGSQPQTLNILWSTVSDESTLLTVSSWIQELQSFFVLRAAAPAGKKLKCLNLSCILVPVLLILSAIWLKEHLHCHFRYSKIRKEGEKSLRQFKVCIYFGKWKHFFPFILLSFRVRLCADVLRGRGEWIFSSLWGRQGATQGSK